MAQAIRKAIARGSVVTKRKRVDRECTDGLLPNCKWAECLCDEIDPADRPCMVCVMIPRVQAEARLKKAKEGMSLPKTGLVAHHIAALTLQTQHNDLKEAKRMKSEAEDEVLKELVASIQPALEAVSSGHRFPNQSGYGTTAALKIATELYIDPSGNFLDGKGATLTIEDVLDVLPLTAIATHLLAAIQAQVGTRTEVIKQIRRETEILNAVISALRLGKVDR